MSDESPSDIIKELSQQCCDEIEGHCYRESSGDEYSYSSFDADKARQLIELYMFRAVTNISKG